MSGWLFVDDDETAEAGDCGCELCGRVIAEGTTRIADPYGLVAHNVRRMLQCLDAYWLHYDGLPKGRNPRGRYDSEDWWNRFESYRAKVQASLKA